MKNETNNTHDLRKFGIIATQGRSHTSVTSVITFVKTSSKIEHHHQHRVCWAGGLRFL